MRKLIVSFILSGVAVTSQGTPMPDQIKRDFIKSGVQSCLVKQRQDPMYKYVMESQLSEYCNCAMTRASELITPEEYYRANQTKNIAPLAPKTEAAGKYCIQKLMKKWGIEWQIKWETLSAEVESLYDKGQYDRAVVVAKKALDLAEKGVDPSNTFVANSLRTLAWLYKTQGQYARAEPLFKRALAILEKAHGPNHPDVATSLEYMAAFYRKTGRAKAAEAMEKRAAAIRAIAR